MFYYSAWLFCYHIYPRTSCMGKKTKQQVLLTCFLGKAFLSLLVTIFRRQGGCTGKYSGAGGQRQDLRQTFSKSRSSGFSSRILPSGESHCSAVLREVRSIPTIYQSTTTIKNQIILLLLNPSVTAVVSQVSL